ncbi:MAG: hypothetical protein RR367_12130, partial [Clostridia bacterium]
QEIRRDDDMNGLEKAQQLAQQLDKSKYCFSLTLEQINIAKRDGLVVVSGASDDLMEFDGAIYDETGAFNGGSIFVTPNGLLKPPSDGGECESKCPYYSAAMKEARILTALWCSDNECAWKYRTDIPHAKFRVYDGEDLYCVGIVFALEDVTKGGIGHEGK